MYSKLHRYINNYKNDFLFTNLRITLSHHPQSTHPLHDCSDSIGVSIPRKFQEKMKSQNSSKQRLSLLECHPLIGSDVLSNAASTSEIGKSHTGRCQESTADEGRWSCCGRSRIVLSSRTHEEVRCLDEAANSGSSITQVSSALLILSIFSTRHSRNPSSLSFLWTQTLDGRCPSHRRRQSTSSSLHYGIAWLSEVGEIADFSTAMIAVWFRDRTRKSNFHQPLSLVTKTWSRL